MDFLEQTERVIATWQGTKPPNQAAHRFAADLAAVIAAFETTRDMLQFEDEPSDFAAALLATKA